jgi:hypothetical protein
VKTPTIIKIKSYIYFLNPNIMATKKAAKKAAKKPAKKALKKGKSKGVHPTS